MMLGQNDPVPHPTIPPIFSHRIWAIPITRPNWGWGTRASVATLLWKKFNFKPYCILIIWDNYYIFVFHDNNLIVILVYLAFVDICYNCTISTTDGCI